MPQKYSLGIDVGSVSTNLVLLGETGEVHYKLYLRTEGRPIEALMKGLSDAAGFLQPGDIIAAAGTTGSGRRLAGAMVNADVVKNEITAHAAAACAVEPNAKTIIEIGGQDSKIIILRDGIPCDFAMNTVCAAARLLPTGRLRGSIYPLRVGSLRSARFAGAHSGRCGVCRVGYDPQQQTAVR